LRNQLWQNHSTSFHFLGSSKKVQSGQLWYPAADVYQTPDGWLVKVELAGVSVEDVEIDIQGNVLSIVGARKDRSCAAGFSYQMEITYSRFEKTLQFPAAIEGARIEQISITGTAYSFVEK
jgi:HSP20 family protein